MTAIGTKGAMAVMGRIVHCVLTITILFGALLLADTAQADDLSFLQLGELVDGVDTGTWSNEVVSAPCGARSDPWDWIVCQYG